MSSRRHGFIRITRTDGRQGVIDGGAVVHVIQDIDVVKGEGNTKDQIPCLGIVLSNNVTLKIVGETEESLLHKVAQAHGQSKIDLF